MAEARKRGSAPVIRGVVLLLMVGTVGYFIWRSATRREDYRGGDIETTGTIEAVTAQLGFKIPGRLEEVLVSEGSEVRAGQLLARLDARDLQIQADGAAATLEVARAARAQAEAALAQARANRDRTGRDLERTSTLMAQDATTAQQMDAARVAAEDASAQVQAAAAQIQAAEAQIHQAQSAQEHAELQLDDAKLAAPQAGLVAEKIHQEGETVPVGSPILSVVQVDTVKVRAAVDETRVGAVRPGDRVEVKVYTFDRQVFTGTVTDIRPAGDFATRKDWGASRRDIRTFMVTARIPNPQHLLKDGMTAEVTIKVDPSVRKMAGAN